MVGRRKLQFLSILGVVGFALGSIVVPAQADVFNTRPISPLGDNDLQLLFTNTHTDVPSGIYFSGPVVDAIAGQSPQAVFTNTAAGGSLSTFILELTSLTASNRFGLYDVADPTKKVQVFSGASAPGDQSLVSFYADGTVDVIFVDSGVVDFSGNFGFYVDVYGAATGAGGDGDPSTFDYTVFSEDSKNLSDAPQALTYQGNGSTKLQIWPLSSGLFTDSEWIIAFEDGLVGGGVSDEDYSDFVVLVESIVGLDPPDSIPTVSAWGLMISALLLLTGSKIFFGRRLAV